MNRRHIAVCGLLAAGGCASRQSSAVEQVLSAETLVLEVENHNWSDVIIYAIHDGTRSRFLELSAAKSTTIPIPESFVGPTGTFQMLVHRIGGADNSVMVVRRGGVPDDYLTPPVSVRTGRTVSLTLESDLRRSSLGVW